MGISVERLSSEPIILMTFDDHATQRQVIDSYMASLELANDTPGSVYRMIDVQQAPTAAPQIVATLTGLLRGMSGAAIDPDLAIAFVGQPISSGASRFFSTLDAALAYTRAQLPEAVV